METQRTSELTERLLALRGSGLDEVRQGPHSLRAIAVVDAVEYVDDSRSTFLDASLLSVVDLGKPLVWVADSALCAVLDERFRAFLMEHINGVVFYGPAEPAVVEALNAAIGNVYNAGDLRTAVFMARELAVTQGKVLFSPGCPSGNGTANHAERGAEFKRAVLDL